ncbi:MAG: hypothetical protein EBZ60_00375 [Betaproteobacteria bacterium]|nr:hypothetical protein [Betaproteobacteria bacterium]
MVWGDTGISPALQNAQDKIKVIIEPVKGLNGEIRTGLQKIEQTCAIISKSKINESKQTIANSPETKFQVFKSEINQAKKWVADQNQQMQNKLEFARGKLAAQASSCESIKSNPSPACQDYKVNLEIWTKLSDASAYYYAEASARLISYEKANELEAGGCTRPGFSIRMWNAEQEHLIPTLKNSSQLFVDILNGS